MYEVAQRAYNHAQKGSTQESIADHIRQYLKRQPLVSFFQDRLISLLEDPNSHMFNDAVGLGRELVRSDDFDALLDKLIQQWMEESKHSTVSIITINKFIGVVDTRKIAKDIKKGIISWLDQWEQAEGEQREWLCRKFELFLYSMNGQLATAYRTGRTSSSIPCLLKSGSARRSVRPRTTLPRAIREKKS